MFFPSSDWQTKNTRGGSRSILHLEIKGIKTKNLLMSHQKAMLRMIETKTDWLSKEKYAWQSLTFVFEIKRNKNQEIVDAAPESNAQNDR